MIHLIQKNFGDTYSNIGSDNEIDDETYINDINEDDILNVSVDNDISNLFENSPKIKIEYVNDSCIENNIALKNEEILSSQKIEFQDSDPNNWTAAQNSITTHNESSVHVDFHENSSESVEELSTIVKVGHNSEKWTQV